MALYSLQNSRLRNLFLRGRNNVDCGGWNVAHAFFKLLCILVTLSLVIWCCYEFSKDEDICEVHFKKFRGDEDSVYPDLGFVLPNRFNETALRTYGKNFNEENYRSFLRGIYWDDKMLDVDYDMVSMKLKDYLIQTCFFETVQDKLAERSLYCKKDFIFERNDNFGDAGFILHLPPNKPIYSASIKLRSSIFQDGIRPNVQFIVLFAYPNHFYRSFSSSFYTWELRNNDSARHYNMRFSLKRMEVIRKRKKKSNGCVKLDNFDAEVRENIIEKFGCRPIMWANNRSEPLCKTKESVHKIMSEHYDQVIQHTANKTYLEPCLNIENLQIDYTERDVSSLEVNSDDGGEGWFEIQFTIMTNKFKEIKQVRKYGIQSLVGNAGGYIGLCLGYALWNVPTIIMGIFKRIDRIYFQ